MVSILTKTLVSKCQWGINVQLIAKTGKSVQSADGGKSKRDHHTRSDAVGIIPMNPGDPTGNEGYAYAINSGEGNGGGGVHVIYFEKDGNIL